MSTKPTEEFKRDAVRMALTHSRFGTSARNTRFTTSRVTTSADVSGTVVLTTFPRTAPRIAARQTRWESSVNQDENAGVVSRREGVA